VRDNVCWKSGRSVWGNGVQLWWGQCEPNQQGRSVPTDNKLYASLIDQLKLHNISGSVYFWFSIFLVQCYFRIIRALLEKFYVSLMCQALTWKRGTFPKRYIWWTWQRALVGHTKKSQTFKPTIRASRTKRNPPNKDDLRWIWTRAKGRLCWCLPVPFLHLLSPWLCSSWSIEISAVVQQ